MSAIMLTRVVGQQNIARFYKLNGQPDTARRMVVC